MMPYVYLFAVLAACLVPLLWPIRAQRRATLIIAAVFMAAGFALYALVGSPTLLPLIAAREARMQELKASIIQHSDAVKAHPKNVSAWVLLGADFMESGQYAASANAFKQGVLLSQGAPELILAYARAMILADEGKVSDDALKSLKMVLLQQPDNADAKYFVTLRKLQDGNTQEAMRDMKALYKSLPPDSPVKEMIDRQIGRR